MPKLLRLMNSINSINSSFKVFQELRKQEISHLTPWQENLVEVARITLFCNHKAIRHINLNATMFQLKDRENLQALTPL